MKTTKLIAGIKITDLEAKQTYSKFFAIGSSQEERIKNAAEDRAWYKSMKFNGKPRYKVVTIYK